MLGLVSPNIHAVRLHFVEWMKQFYVAEGEPFEAFGFEEIHRGGQNNIIFLHSMEKRRKK